MKKNILFIMVVILFLLSACGSNEISNSIVQLEHQEVKETSKEDSIKNSLIVFPEIKETSVVIDNNNAVISISLANELNEADLINLKERIIQKVQKSNAELNRVVVNTGLEMKEDLVNEKMTKEEAEIKEALKKNENKEIFEIPAPNL